MSSTKRTILVIDDNQDILEVLDVVLTMEGYIVVQASTQDDVDAIMKKNDGLPELILLDVLLSGQDGRIIAKSLKSAKKTSHIPIIMMSAHPNVAKTIKESGADDFLPKPFEMSDLLSKIKQHLALSLSNSSRPEKSAKK